MLGPVRPHMINDFISFFSIESNFLYEHLSFVTEHFFKAIYTREKRRYKSNQIDILPQKTIYSHKKTIKDNTKGRTRPLEWSNFHLRIFVVLFVAFFAHVSTPQWDLGRRKVILINQDICNLYSIWAYN